MFREFGVMIEFRHEVEMDGLTERHEVPGKQVMDRKEVIQMCMESPLYFTMPLKMRLEFVTRRARFYSSNGLREDLLSWVRTGYFNPAE
jgi:hypothetical protein